MNTLIQKKTVAHNILIVIKAVAVALWFHGLGRVFDLCVPHKKWITSIAMLLISSALLLMDDGTLAELHEMKPAVSAIINARSRKRRY